MSSQVDVVEFAFVCHGGSEGGRTWKLRALTALVCFGNGGLEGARTCNLIGVMFHAEHHGDCFDVLKLGRTEVFSGLDN